MACAAVVVDDDMGGARADLDEAYTELDLLLRENALACREPCADDILGDDAGGVLAPEVGATEGDDDRLDALAGHALRGHHRGLDGVDGLLEVDDHAFAQAFGRAFPNAEDAHGSSRLVRLCDDHRDPGCAQVETDGFLPPRQRVLERLLERGDGRLAGCRGLYRLR